jgi:hypothetical protein
MKDLAKPGIWALSVAVRLTGPLPKGAEEQEVWWALQGLSSLPTLGKAVLVKKPPIRSSEEGRRTASLQEADISPAPPPCA